MEGRGLSNAILIGVSTDGASSMVGNENGFVTFLKNYVRNLVGIHCIDQREALVALDASKRIAELLVVEKLTNKIYSWAHKSTKRNSELISLQELMQLGTLNSLQINGFRCL